jgi:redox-sensitive bicupin YhaK (pirin superfamily)
MHDEPILIEGRERDLGSGFRVRRMLPQLAARHVGPFVFFDQMGPVPFVPGEGLDVRPHPHIGLATVTWLFAGSIRHRDSLGSVADIHPGDVNWMTAGRGIVHSERTPPETRIDGDALHGIQVWVALPREAEEIAPEFHHHPAAELPVIEREGIHLTVIAGDAYGRRSPVKVFAPMFLIQARMAAGSSLPMPVEHEERGVFVVAGDVALDDVALGPAGMAVQFGGDPPLLSAKSDATVMLFGGAPLDGERHLWWNFVSSSKERIEQAKADWAGRRFPAIPGDDAEYIPLPD